jgi:hypothetical protein
MGTRNLTLVKSNGEYKVAQYSQWDGYPEGQGFIVVNFLNQSGFDIELFKNKINNIIHWSGKDIDKLDENIDYDSYPELAIDLGAEVFYSIYNGKITKVNLSINFASNSLFCEWAWCVNLDTNCLDCFKGFQTEPLSNDQPFYFLQDKMTEKDVYYPIKLICSIPFDEVSKFNTKYDFKNYIDDIIQMGDKPIMDNGVPVIWEENI